MVKREPFDWDEKKNSTNKQKHGFSFEGAQDAFEDPYILDLPDRLSSDDEDRWIGLGMLPDGRIISVVYVDQADKVRLISARLATPSERKSYGKRRG